MLKYFHFLFTLFISFGVTLLYWLNLTLLDDLSTLKMWTFDKSLRSVCFINWVCLCNLSREVIYYLFAILSLNQWVAFTLSITHVHRHTQTLISQVIPYCTHWVVPFTILASPSSLYIPGEFDSRVSELDVYLTWSWILGVIWHCSDFFLGLVVVS